MTVSQLSGLLEHLARGLEPVVAAGVTTDLLALKAAMSPFADRKVADFTKFLGQCEEFQRTGAVSGTKGRGPAAKAPVDPDRVPKAVASVRAAFVEIDRGTMDERRIEQVLQPIGAMAKGDLDAVLAQLGFAGKSKSKADAVKRVRQRLSNQAEAGSRVQTMREDR
jgi:hypothetical protein